MHLFAENVNPSSYKAYAEVLSPRKSCRGIKEYLGQLLGFCRQPRLPNSDSLLLLAKKEEVFVVASRKSRYFQTTPVGTDHSSLDAITLFLLQS